MKTNIFLIFILSFALFSCDQKKDTAAPTDTTAPVVEEKLDQSMPNSESACICTKEYAPVCGKNGVEYGNSCEANCAGVEFSDGPCSQTN